MLKHCVCYVLLICFVEYFIEYGYSRTWQKNNKEYHDDAVIGNIITTIPNVIMFDNILLGLNGYFIKPDFIGAYSGVYHTGLPITFSDVWYSENPQSDHGVIYNNRQGADIKMGFELSFLFLNLIYGQSKTIKKTRPTINFT